MARPMWFVNLIKKNFKYSPTIADLTKNFPLMNHFVNWLLFEDDLYFYLPKDKVVINQAIRPTENIILPSEVVKHFIEAGQHLFIMDKCLCREATQCKDYPINIGCLFIGEPTLKISRQLGHPASKSEALEHIQRASEAGLVHSIGRNKLDTIWLGATPGYKLLTICNCCPCCCLFRVVPHLHPIISSKITHMPGVNVTVDEQRCHGCGRCTQLCMTQAIKIENQHAQINPSICIGCGRCVEVCPQHAVQLNIFQSQFIDETIRQINEQVDIS